MDEDLINQVQELAEEGLGRVLIARRLGISDSMASRILKKLREGDLDEEKAKKLRKEPSSEAKKITRINRVDEVKACMEDMDVYDIAKKYKTTKHEALKLIKKAKDQYSPINEWITKISFKGIKLSELQKLLNIKTKERAIEILQETFKDCFVVETKLSDGDIRLNPVANSIKEVELPEIDTSKKKFKFFVSDDYMLVKFDDNLPGDKIKIWLLSDLHCGSKAFRGELLKHYIEIIKNDPMSFVLLNGDLIENNSRQSAGNPMEQYETVNEQILEIIEMLIPIADKVLLSNQGNHEQRSSRFADVDIAELIAKMLKVPYFKNRITIDYSWRGVEKTQSLCHKYGNAIDQTAILREVRKVLSATTFPIHFFLSGHSHDHFIRRLPSVYKEIGKGLVNKDSIIVNAGSFTVDRGTYVQDLGLLPSCKDIAYIWFDDEDEYGAGSEAIQSI